MTNYYKKNKNRHYRNNSEPLESRLLAMIGKGLWALLVLPFKKKNPKFAEFAKRWADVQDLMKRDEPIAWTSALLKADTLLNDALKDRFAGENLGERLKNARATLDPETYNVAWHAHILRNKIAHEHTEPGKQEAQQAIYEFRTVLNKLGVL